MTARALGADDEAALQRLLRSVYGETYSYRDLYQPGGLRRLLATGQALLFGDFTARGELFSHTAFLLKDPRGEYVESGMSLRDPWLREHGRAPDADAWAMLFARVPEGVAYVHQNTTTLHPLAQRYASRYMRAAPSGLIADYSIGERLAGFSSSDAPAQSLTMTTALAPAPTSREVTLPDTLWSPWISARLSRWNRRLVSSLRPIDLDSLSLGLVEDNRDLSLRRRSIDRGEGAPLVTTLARDRARTDLVHVPLDDRSAALPWLLDEGYLPVGIRPHARRPDELIVQHLTPDRREAVSTSLRAARFHGEESRGLISDWIERCGRTS